MPKKMPFWKPFYRKSTFILQPKLPTKTVKWLVFFCGFFLVTFVISAQQINDNQCDNQPGVGSGGMMIVNPVGCIPLTINVKNTQNGSVKSRYIYDYKGGNPNLQPYKPDTATTFTYTKPGVYLLMQLSENAVGQPQRACQRVTVQDPTPPTFKVIPCANGKVILSITNHTLVPYDEYLIEWGDGNVEIINRLNLTTAHQFLNLSPKQVSVRGRHNVSKCGGISARMVLLETNGRPGTLTKLDIIDGSTAELTIANPNFFDLELYRQEGAGQYQTTGKTLRGADEKVKVLIDTTKIFCYKLKPLDSCIAALESNVLCVSFLKVIPDLEQNSVVTTPYRYPTDIVKITVLKNNIPWWSPGFADLFKVDNQAECGRQSCYRLQLETRNGIVLSNTVCANPPPALCTSLSSVFIPDVFTPNGDGINDTFEVKGNPDDQVEILIYNSWGTPIFLNKPTEHTWNGTINGSPAPSGPYIYRVSIIDAIGRRFVKRGSVSLLR